MEKSQTDTNNNKPASDASVVPASSGTAVKSVSAPRPAYQGSKPAFVAGGKPPFKPSYGGAKGSYAGKGGFQGRKPSHGGKGGSGFVKPEIDYKILNIRRVARITKGGKRFTFSVALVVGDKKGSVGVGVGKAGDTASAIEKAIKSGKKNIIKVKATKEMSIAHETEAKYSSSRVQLRPAVGRGLVAGSSARVVLSLAGLTDISTKFHSRTKNQLNNAQATIEALRKLG